MSNAEKYPHAGEWFYSDNKKFEETILFVPFYKGSKKSLKRHIEFVNRLGFNAFAFHLPSGPHLTALPFSSTKKFGHSSVIADQIEYFLNEIPGNKIIFAFSNPCAAAIEAIARRNAADIKGLICDSGPSGKFLESAYNLITHEFKTKFLPLRLAQMGLVSLLWSPDLLRTTHDDLETFPRTLPILSVRGWKDKLIPPDHIDAIFEPHKHLNWRKLSLPEAGHLLGLKDFPEDYEPGIKKYLTEIATSHP